jgi:hypothetical protein
MLPQRNKKGVAMKKIVLLALAITIVGCTSGKTSAERHAYAFARQHSQILSGTLVESRNASYQANLPQFKDIYRQGAADRKAGMKENEANQYAKSIREQVTSGLKTRSTFTGNTGDKWEQTAEHKDALLFGNELSATYLDGYFGR